MAEKKSVEVVVGQHKLSLKTDQDPLRVKKAAEMVNDRISRLLPFGQPLSQQVLLVAAMTLADELLQAEVGGRRFKDQVRAKSEALLTRLEKEFPL